MDRKELGNRFEHHQVDQLAHANIVSVREACSGFALLINALVPEGREKSLAVTNLEQVMFWANAGISRSGTL